MRMGRRGAAYVAAPIISVCRHRRRVRRGGALGLTSDEGREMQIALNFGWPRAIMTGIYAWSVIYAVLHNGETRARATVASAALLVLLLWWGGFHG